MHRVTAASTNNAMTVDMAGPLRVAINRRRPLFVGIAVLGVLCGALIGLAGLNALYLCLCALGCAVILFDFRIGVALLILLMPISGSYVFPHAMLGITGLNPLNLL